MTKIIMHGCNGRMGQAITRIAATDETVKIVAGIDVTEGCDNGYPVYKNIAECKEEADVIIDFASAKAIDALLDYVSDTHIPIVVCTTGLSEEQKARLEEVSKEASVLVSANMSLGINVLFKKGVYFNEKKGNCRFFGCSNFSCRCCSICIFRKRNYIKSF